jgi:hypothetical protein
MRFRDLDREQVFQQIALTALVNQLPELIINRLQIPLVRGYIFGQTVHIQSDLHQIAFVNSFRLGQPFNFVCLKKS